MLEMHAVNNCDGKFVEIESGSVIVVRCPKCQAQMYRMVEANGKK